MKKDKERMTGRIFSKKTDWVWIIFLLLGGMAVIFALIIDMGIIDIGSYVDRICKTEVRNKLWQASETMCNVIATYSTMLAAVVVFFYSMIDNKRIGIPYRRLISYTVGSRTIPVLFMTTLLLTVFMEVARCISLEYTVYVCMGYILIVQIFVIIEILVSTSYQHCKRVICRIERRRYLAGVDPKEKSNTEWAYSMSHLERAIHSEEFISDKKEFNIVFVDSF